MPETTDVVNSAGLILARFLKYGPSSPTHASELADAIFDTFDPIIPRPADVSSRYKETCEYYFSRVIQERGIPKSAVFSAEVNLPKLAVPSKLDADKAFDLIVPQLRASCGWCVENFAKQSEEYFNAQREQLRELILQFSKQVPVGGAADKIVRSLVTDIKREIRYLSKWDKLFYTYKASSLVSELEYILTLQSNPIAVIWRYSPLDEQGEYSKSYDHKEWGGRIYAVRGNWALEKGLMNAGPYGYIDEISRPKQDVGCMCGLQWLYSLRSLPDGMITPIGKAELARAKAIIARL
jgi:hypothetical protein